MLNSMMIFNFSFFDREYAFWANLVQKNENCQFKVELGTLTNSNMQNSIGMLTFFVFNRKYPLWDNLFQKIKIVNLRWNLIPRLIRICRIQWCCSLFLFSSGNSLLGQIWSKLLYLQFFFCFRSEMSFFGKIWSKMSKLSVEG